MMSVPVRTLIVGAGPAGTAVLSAADKNGCLPELVHGGLVIADKGEIVGRGQLGQYTIRSDSTAETFLTAINQSKVESLRALENDPVVQAIAAHIGDLGVPLPKAGIFLELLGEHLIAFVKQHGTSVMMGHEAVQVQRVSGGLWRTRLRDCASGNEKAVISHNVISATGGEQPYSLIEEKIVAGIRITERYKDKLLPSDAFLAEDGFKLAQEVLGTGAVPKLVVVGGSTSALASVNKLLRTDSGLTVGTGAITLLHRRPLRPFYHSIEAAHAEGYTDFGPDDICPVSGFVYRLGGFRLEARDLVVRMLGIAGRQGDPRLALHQINDDDDAAAARILEEADLIIPALGYLPRALPLLDQRGQELKIAAREPHHPPMVDGACRVLDSDGQPVPGLYGIGLAAGFVPHGRLGGEKSFRGQANGLWLWQNDVGQLIVDQILGRSEEARAVA